MTQTNSEFKPKKEREYRLYLIWKNMSRPMKELGIPYLDQMGIQNEDIRELAGITTQTAFSQKYGVDQDTLTFWNKQTPPKEYEQISWKNWLKEMEPEIVRLVTTGLAERKDPASAKFLMELNGSYTQKSEVKIDGTQELFDNVRIILESVKGGE